jgi:2-dehydro-3-deoxyphosphogluconate aldolase/(4S)-4-hydroxy-2-oxoglutarate aldolase
MTPSDIEAAIELECRELKFFPAESSGGLKQLTNMKAPYAHLGVRFIPLGGINTQNMATYLAEPAVLALGGSWLAPADRIRNQDWGKIASTAAEARRIVDTIRS